MLELKNISFQRDHKKILDQINLTFDENAFYVITGANGSGKSTLAKIIMGLIKPDSGQILFNGQDITDKNASERANLGIGFAFQQPVCFKGITVLDLLKIAEKNKVDKKEICDLLSAVGLCAKEYIHREVNHSLSGGELKRIEIATVFARHPKLAIFDEPEAGIDLWSFQNLTEVFQKMKENDRITLVISHQERILNLADQIIVMEKGKVKQMGKKEEILSSLLQPVCCKKGGDSCESCR